MGLFAGARRNGLDQIATLVCAGRREKAEKREGKKSRSCPQSLFTKIFFFFPSLAICDRNCGYGFCANTGFDINECVCNQNFFTFAESTPCTHCMTPCSPSPRSILFPSPSSCPHFSSLILSMQTTAQSAKPIMVFATLSISDLMT